MLGALRVLGWAALSAAALGLLTPSAAAQTWTRLYYGGSQGSFRGVAATQDGGAYAAGFLPGSPTWNAGLVTKADRGGRVEWARLLRGAPDGGGTIWDAAGTADGGVVVAGHFGPEPLALVKLDASGDLEWKRGYGDPVRRTSCSGEAVAATQDGGVIVTGGGLDCLLWKLDAQGGTEWAMRYGTWYEDWCRSVVQTTDGGYLVASITTDWNSEEDYLLVLRLDNVGSLLWYRFFGGAVIHHNAAAREASDGSVFISSGSIIGRLDADGNLIWARDFGGNPTFELDPASGGDVVAAGLVSGAGGDVWVLRIAASGDSVWQKRYGVAGPIWESAMDVRVLPGGEILVAAVSTLLDPNGVPWLLRLGSEGQVGPLCDLVSDTSVDPVDTVLTEPDVVVRVYPPDGEPLEGDMLVADYTPSVFTQCCSFTSPEVPSEVSAPGSGAPLVFRDRVTLSWEEGTASESCYFNLYRGDLSALQTGSYGACLRAGIPLIENFATDTAPPPPGGGWAYLVTGANTLGEGPLGTDWQGAPRSNLTPCP